MAPAPPHASDVARILGTSRRHADELAAEGAFPRSLGRAAIEAWAAERPDAAPAWRRPELRPPYRLTGQPRQIFKLAADEAKALHHARLEAVHLLLALQHPNCPGGARQALGEHGPQMEAVRRSAVQRLGRPEKQPHGLSMGGGPHAVLEGALREAIELRDEEVTSEHVLLSLIDAGEVEGAQLAERAMALAGRAEGAGGTPPSADPVPPELHAAQVAAALGVSRARVAELAVSPGFPTSEASQFGWRVWPRREVLLWAAGHPDRGPLRPRTALAGRALEAEPIFRLAEAEAEQLDHPWVDRGHLLLALLHPDCRGAAGAAVRSFGATPEALRCEWAASMGDPFEPGEGPPVASPATHHTITRAQLYASELEDDEVTGEHVLLALLDDWPGSACGRLVGDRGADAETVRERLVASGKALLPLPAPAVARASHPPSPTRAPRLPEPELAPSPLGHDPRRRRPWGSAVFATDDGAPLPGSVVRGQYFIDRDGSPVLTTGGEPVHLLVDEERREMQDEGGEPIGFAVVDIPPGTHMRAYHMR